MTPQPIHEDELQAWADRRLPAERQAQVESYLEQHPDTHDRLQAYQAQNRGLQSLFQPVLEEDIPPHLQELPRPAPLLRQRFLTWPWQSAAAVLLVLSGALAGWQAHTYLPSPSLAAALPRQAAIAHAVYTPEVRHPVEVGADQETHLAAWLSKRLGAPLHPPRLGAQGFELVGGRLLPGGQGPVALFMYQDGGGQRLTLYVSGEGTGSGDTSFRFSREGDVSVFYWVDGRFGYALSGTLDKASLGTIATQVYQQLEAR